MANINQNDALRNFLLSFGKALNVSGLEQELQIGNRTLRDWLRGTRSFNPASRAKVEVWAARYGFTPKGK